NAQSSLEEHISGGRVLYHSGEGSMKNPGIFIWQPQHDSPYIVMAKVFLDPNNSTASISMKSGIVRSKLLIEGVPESIVFEDVMNPGNYLKLGQISKDEDENGNPLISWERILFNSIDPDIEPAVQQDEDGNIHNVNYLPIKQYIIPTFKNNEVYRDFGRKVNEHIKEKIIANAPKLSPSIWLRKYGLGSHLYRDPFIREIRKIITSIKEKSRIVINVENKYGLKRYARNFLGLLSLEKVFPLSITEADMRFNPRREIYQDATMSQLLNEMRIKSDLSGIQEKIEDQLYIADDETTLTFLKKYFLLHPDLQATLESELKSYLNVSSWEKAIELARNVRGESIDKILTNKEEIVCSKENFYDDILNGYKTASKTYKQITKVRHLDGVLIRQLVSEAEKIIKKTKNLHPFVRLDVDNANKQILKYERYLNGKKGKIISFSPRGRWTLDPVNGEAIIKEYQKIMHVLLKPLFSENKDTLRLLYSIINFHHDASGKRRFGSTSSEQYIAKLILCMKKNAVLISPADIAVQNKSRKEKIGEKMGRIHFGLLYLSFNEDFEHYPKNAFHFLMDLNEFSISRDEKERARVFLGPDNYWYFELIWGRNPAEEFRLVGRLHVSDRTLLYRGIEFFMDAQVDKEGNVDPLSVKGKTITWDQVQRIQAGEKPENVLKGKKSVFVIDFYQLLKNLLKKDQED
ncbi:MAG: hypothetical protein ACFFCS_25280, partial [Candidatus Hodarchaeota archaeon]